MRPGTPFRTYGIALKSAMTQRRVTVRGLAAALELDQSTIVDWRRGGRLPEVDNARSLAEHLDRDYLLTDCVELRTQTCMTCDKQFIRDNKGGRTRKYCQPRCAQNGASRRKRYGREVSTAMYVAEHKQRHARILVAIADFCRSCEWDGRCKDSTCDLREWSPLPLEKGRQERDERATVGRVA